MADEYQLPESHFWVSQTKDHWKEFRPKMYADLEKSGKLHERAVHAARQTDEELLNLVNDGQDYQSAWEAVRERYMFLPSEEDVPNLGGNPGSLLEETEVVPKTERCPKRRRKTLRFKP